MRSGIRRAIAATLCLAFASGCISNWNRFPSATRGRTGSLDQTLYYDDRSVKGMFGGASALHRAFEEGTPFREVHPRNEIPEEGPFVRVEAKRIAPHAGSGGFAILSYALLFLIPFRSTEGYTMRYQAYVDGEEKHIFEYDITRRTYVWLVLIPFSWISLIGPSEGDAFEATAYQFFKDSAPYFAGDRNWP